MSWRRGLRWSPIIGQAVKLGLSKRRTAHHGGQAANVRCRKSNESTIDNTAGPRPADSLNQRPAVSGIPRASVSRDAALRAALVTATCHAKPDLNAANPRRHVAREPENRPLKGGNLNQPLRGTCDPDHL